MKHNVESNVIQARGVFLYLVGEVVPKVYEGPEMQNVVRAYSDYLAE